MPKSQNLKRIILQIVFINILIFNANFGLDQEIITDNLDQITSVKLKESKIWDLTGSPIDIDDLDPTKNWTFTASNYDWCNGTGTWNDPYIIENITIDGGETDTCISIKNSSVYFIIKNCRINNPDVGLHISNASNGEIKDNILNDYLFFGISIFNTYNISIIRNTLNGFYRSNVGIDSEESNYTTIIKNEIYFGDKGIHFTNSNNSYVYANDIENCRQLGISLSGYKNTAINNTMEKCGLTIGIYYGNSHNIDKTNLVNGKPFYYYVNKNRLTSDNFTNAGQVILFNCINSIISDLSIYEASSGIRVYFCENISISKNYIEDNYLHGLLLINCSMCKIFENTLKNNLEEGIKLRDCENCTLKANLLIKNKRGVELMGSYGCSIFLNCFIENYNNPLDNGFSNQWDNGTIGNYWDDYTGEDSDNDGIGDTPYTIEGSAGSTDDFPLIKCPFYSETDDFPVLFVIILSASLIAFAGVSVILIRRKLRS